MEPSASIDVSSTIHSLLSWAYTPRSERLAELYDRARLGQWNGATDIDWDCEVAFGSLLLPDSTFAEKSFTTSSLSRFGPQMWNQFRWEFQAWMTSQFLHGEQGAMIVAARQVETMPDLDNKMLAAIQAGDEARHVEVFARYLHDKLPHQYQPSAPLQVLLSQLLADGRWDISALGMQIMIESLALAAFRLSRQTFNDPLIKEILRRTSRDEARHVGFGVLALQRHTPTLSATERREREDLAAEYAVLIRREFLLDDIWLRLGVPVNEGRHWAAENPMMIAYRQAIFVKVITSLRQVGLFSPRLMDRFIDLGLLSATTRRRLLAGLGAGA